MSYAMFDVAARMVRAPAFFMFLGYAFYVLTVPNDYKVEGLGLAVVSVVVVLWMFTTIYMEGRAVMRDIEAWTGRPWNESDWGWRIYGFLTVLDGPALMFGYYGLR